MGSGPYKSIPSLTNALTLDEVTARLAGKTAVSGIMWIDSTGTDRLTPHLHFHLISEASSETIL